MLRKIGKKWKIYVSSCCLMMRNYSKLQLGVIHKLLWYQEGIHKMSSLLDKLDLITVSVTVKGLKKDKKCFKVVWKSPLRNVCMWKSIIWQCIVLNTFSVKIKLFESLIRTNFEELKSLKNLLYEPINSKF